MVNPCGQILVIDESPQIQLFLSRILDASGYTVEQAVNGTDGLRLVQTFAPVVILLEIALPDMNGLELLGRLRSFSFVPVIVLSRFADEAHKVAAFDAGADDYVVKPFSQGELLARIRVAMRHRPAEHCAAGVLRFPGLEVDISRRRVLADGQPLPLTPKEWTLLSLFARNAGRVLTYRQLLTAVWGADSVDNIEYLRVYVGRLRKKLGSTARLIATQADEGYRFGDYCEAPSARGPLY